jgi:hypothetical protein
MTQKIIFLLIITINLPKFKWVGLQHKTQKLWVPLKWGTEKPWVWLQSELITFGWRHKTQEHWIWCGPFSLGSDSWPNCLGPGRDAKPKGIRPDMSWVKIIDFTREITSMFFSIVIKIISNLIIWMNLIIFMIFIIILNLFELSFYSF